MRSPDDPGDEFRKAVAGVRPLAPVRRRAAQRPAAAPIPLQRLRDERAALAESLDREISPDSRLETGEELVYAREGLARSVLRRLRRGHWVVEDQLDLHGMNRIEAAEQVAQFLRACVSKGSRCLRIVHGKGLGSRNREPVLKAKLGHWLSTRDEVLAYCQAPDSQGGSGAVLVLLKARRGRAA
jgi:DNA-nicking Smr family endonuclease